MAANAILTGPNGQDPRTAIRMDIHAATTVTVGDLLFCGQIFRSRILARTAKGLDVNGAPFVGYSQRGPYYFYPNREAGTVRFGEGSASPQIKARAARRTAAANRYKKTGKLGVRTPYGIRYASYGAMKAALGRSTVDLFGAEQHTHMLNCLLVKCGGVELPQSADAFLHDTGEMAAFEQNQPASQLALGFYGPEAERAKGHNEGVPSRGLPKREFFGLSQEDLQIGERAIVQRMTIRARSGHTGPQGGSSSAPSAPISDDRNDWISF